MTTQNYDSINMNAHNAETWLGCPASAKLGNERSRLYNNPESAGRAAHELAEMFLKYKLGVDEKDALQKRYDAFRAHSLFYSQELENYANTYAAYCMERYNAARAVDEGVRVLVEERIDFGKWLPDKTGVVDFAVIANGTLQIVDMKTGAMRVTAKENHQLHLYAL